MGHVEQVFDDVQQFRRQMDALPSRPSPGDLALSWNVRETLLDTGLIAALKLDRWQDALNLNAEIIASKRARRAPVDDIARSRVNDHAPLLRLGRTDQAMDLLLDCRQTFHDTGDIQALGMTLSALADAEDSRGHGDAAIRLERDALRYRYRSGDILGITLSYHNLGLRLHIRANQPTAALAAHLAAGLIRALTGADGAGSVLCAAIELRVLGSTSEPPTDIADLCDRLADIKGTNLPGLIAKLSPEPQTAERTLRDLIVQARQLAEEPPPDDGDHR
jgi:hypothetical protein